MTTSHVSIVFEPPLAEPGVLTVDHEGGLHVELLTDRAGVELDLPPGPVMLRLRVGERVFERSVVIDGGGTHLVVPTVQAAASTAH